jgi:hypothetical protein
MRGKRIGDQRGVPFEADLRRDITELLLAERNPSISAVTDITTKHRDRVAVGTQRRQRDRRLLRPQVRQELIKIKRAPPPRILVGEFDEPSHQAAAHLDGVYRQTPSEHLSSPSVHHRDEDCLISSKQRNVVETQNARNEPRQLLSHASGRPQPAQPSTRSLLDDGRPSQRGTPMGLRHGLIRHSDVLLAMPGEGRGAVDCRLQGRPSRARSRVSPNSRINH